MSKEPKAGYSKEGIIARVQAAAEEDISKFYQKSFINYTGHPNNSPILYTELIAEWLLKPDHLALFDKDITIHRTNYSYWTKTHTGNTTKNKTKSKTSSEDSKNKKRTVNREEEKIAMSLFKQQTLGPLGMVLDYQVPLSATKNDKGVGAIDLLAYDGKVLRILELKKPSSKETMLRCVCESYTYLKIIDKEKLINDFNKKLSKDMQIPADTPLQACPLVFKDSAQYKELHEDKSSHTNLEALMKKLDIKPYYLCYTVEM